jgi:hypothetical protein
MRMQVSIGPLARVGLEAHSGNDLGSPVRAALIVYARRLQSGRPPARYPAFLPPAGDRDPATVVEIEVDQALASTFEREAEAQGTTAAELAGHAVLLYLAELDRVDELSIATAGGSARPDREKD